MYNGVENLNSYKGGNFRADVALAKKSLIYITYTMSINQTSSSRTPFDIDCLEAGIDRRSSFTIDWRTLPCTLIADVRTGQIDVKFETGKTVFVKESEMLILPGNIAHAMRAEKSLVRWIHVNFRVYSTVDVMSLIALPLVITGGVATAMGDTIEAFVSAAEIENKLLSSPVAEKRSLLFHLLAQVLSLGSPIAARMGRDLERISPALSTIRSCLSKTIRRASLASVCGISLSAFNNIFKRVMQMPPSQYLEMLRMKEAQIRLVQTEAPVYEVARTVGYRDPFYFTRVFTKFNGLSPSEYRKTTRNVFPSSSR